jgi:HK97 family phage prohead protease
MIHAFWSHDPAMPLGSTRSGKLELKEDDTGLRFRLPAKRLNEAQLDAVMDGDMRMSFGFVTREDKWERGANNEPDRRTLLDVDLLEVSLVSMPAYADTSVALRAFEAWQAEQEAVAPDPDPADTAAQEAARAELAAKKLATQKTITRLAAEG